MYKVYPVEFQTQSDVSGTALGISLDEVEDVDFHIAHPVVSISVEMSRHLGLIRIMCYLVEMPLEPMFQTVLGLADVLFPAYCAGYTIYQVVTVTADVVSCSVLFACDWCNDMAISVQFRAVLAAMVLALLGGSSDMGQGVPARREPGSYK